MKYALLIFLMATSMIVVAQTHQIGLNGGVNTIASWGGDPPFGEGSPFDSNVGYSVNLFYTYRFSNNIALDLRNSLTFLNFQSDNSFAFRDENNEVVRADKKYQEQHYQLSLGGGYLFAVSERYSIKPVAGVSLFSHYKYTTYSVGYPETRSERKLEWEKDNQYYGVFLAMDHNYRLQHSRHYDLYLIGSLRATQIFDYAVFGSNLNRILPELTLGVAVTFGKQNRGRF